jgi:hypothetical protein
MPEGGAGAFACQGGGAGDLVAGLAQALAIPLRSTIIQITSVSQFREVRFVRLDGGGFMEAMISSLLSRFERGTLTRRELVQGLTMIAAAGGPAAAQAQEAATKGAKIDR